MSLPQHSSASNEHYSPPEIIEAARTVMGGIDLDPASCELANSKIVKASNYFDEDADGLTRQWARPEVPERVWLNPPGGLREEPVWWSPSKSNMFLWWSKLVAEYKAGRVREAMFLGFTLEILATSQQSRAWACDFPFCIPENRLRFYWPVSHKRLGIGNAPTHANVVVYLPPLGDDGQCAATFKDNFSRFGAVRL